MTLTVLSYFNSIKVRLKQEYEKRKRENRIFQFHKGTIKTELTRDNASLQQQFQFHKGTIKTDWSFEEQVLAH